ncbi:hypothetical protein [Kitasatospora sp. NPDC088783]|uniref:hypothetical protein n=1 Tax=Kitasatospora sp. NPDC088783 TaxID=3364077 RepID=UPI00380CB241
MGIGRYLGSLARVSAVAALVVGAVAAPAVSAAAAPAAADGSGSAAAGVWRKAVISGPFTIRDDEGWAAGTYCRGEVHAENWTNGTVGPNEWWRTYCGGEIRVELHAYASVVDAAGTLEFGLDAFFFEGTNDRTTDLDDEVTGVRVRVPAGQSVPYTVYLKNGENGGKDWATLDLTFSNAA